MDSGNERDFSATEHSPRNFDTLAVGQLDSVIDDSQILDAIFAHYWTDFLTCDFLIDPMMASGG
jgi:hypothetical protein